MSMNDPLMPQPVVQPPQSSPPINSQKNDSYRSILSVSSLCIGFLLILLVFPVSGKRMVTSAISRYITRDSYIQAENQPIQTPITIKSLRLKKAGYIVVYLQDYYDSPSENPLLVTSVYDGYYTKGIPISIDLPAFESIRNDQNPSDQSGLTVYATIAYQHDASEFANTSEELARDVFGNIIQAPVVLR